MDKLNHYFTQLAHLTKNRKITVQHIKDAAAATGDVSEITDAILAHAQAQGINPEKELTDLYNARSAAQEKAAERKRRETIKTVLADIEKQSAELTAGIDAATPEELSAALSSIGAEAAGLTTAAVEKNRFPSWADYEAAWQKETDQDFSPALFNRLAFPEGTVSYIGARTGRGKTTALVNIGIEALFSDTAGIDTGTNKPRRVLFVSLEENHKQILRRFSLCLAYRNADETAQQKLLTVANPYTQKKDPKNVYKNWKRGRDTGIKEYGAGAAVFVKAVIEADRKIRDAVETGSLVYFDGIGAPLHEILAAIRAGSKGDIVLLDYIQKIPAAGNTYSGNPDLERIRDGSAKLIEAAKGAECVIIAGAQFNREGAKGSHRADDIFTDADFRGCGDLEQDGHNLIGIGRSADKTRHYYGIIKSREGELTDALYTLDFAGGYSFMGCEGTEFIPKSAKAGGRNGSRKTTKVYNDDGTYEEVEFTGGAIL